MLLNLTKDEELTIFLLPFAKQGDSEMLTVRMKAHEEKLIQKKIKEFNDQLEADLQGSITATQMVHDIIRLALPKAKLDKYGNVVVDVMD